MVNAAKGVTPGVGYFAQKHAQLALSALGIQMPENHPVRAGMEGFALGSAFGGPFGGALAGMLGMTMQGFLNYL